MKIQVENHALITASIPPRLPYADLKLWQENIARFLYLNIQNKKVSLFTLKPDKTYNIGYDYEGYLEGKFNSKKYLASLLDVASHDFVKTLVEADEFYLGHTILVLGHLTQENIEQLVLHWDREIVLSKVEFFKMDNDGLCFYWYNPTTFEQAEQSFKNLLQN